MSNLSSSLVEFWGPKDLSDHTPSMSDIVAEIWSTEQAKTTWKM
jgi:hypothetical protein